MSKSLLPEVATGNTMTFEGRNIVFRASSQFSSYAPYAVCSQPNGKIHWLSSQSNYPHWISVNLGETLFIGTVSFYPIDGGGALVKDYEIQISMNDNNFSTVHSATYVPENRIASNVWQKELVRINKRARYIKINVLNGYSSNKWVGITGLGITDSPGLYMIYKNTSSSGGVYGMSNGTWQLLSSNWDSLSDTDKEAIFNSVDTSVQPTDADLRALGKFKVLIYSEEENNSKVKLTAVPNKQVVTPTGLIPIDSFQNINTVTITAHTAGNGAVGVAVTTDNKNYYTYSASTGWQQILDVATQSMTVSALNSISGTDWDTITANADGIGFAYVLDMDATTDTANVDNIVFNVNMNGTWKRAVHGTDYDYAYSNSTLTVDIKANGDYKINYPN